MTLPLGAFDSFIEQNGIKATILCRALPLSDDVEQRFDVRGFLEVRGASAETVGTERMSYMQGAFHLPAKEVARVGMPRAPRSGDILEANGQAFFVRAVHHVTFRNQTVRYVLELATEDL